MNPKAEELKIRTRQFALDVIALVKTFPKTAEGETVRRQLTKAATGVAANYRSTCRSRSHDEFVARMAHSAEWTEEAAATTRQSLNRPIHQSILQSRNSAILQYLDQFRDLFHCILRGVQDGPPFLKRRRAPVLVLEPDAAVA